MKNISPSTHQQRDQQIKLNKTPQILCSSEIEKRLKVRL